MINFDGSFILLHISVILLVIMFLYIFKISPKKQIHYAFLGLIGALFIWSISTVCRLYIYKLSYNNSLFFFNCQFIGLVMVPVALFLVSNIFAYTKINFNWKYKLLFLIPIISIIMIFTNEYHHLFIKQFSYGTDYVLGPYANIHVIYSYSLILIGLYYFAYFSIKNSGFFSKQSLLIIIGCLVPLIVNVLLTIQVVDLPFYSDTIAFSFAAICWMFAIFKFDFLNIIPIALQRVVDLISDSYIVLNENMDIIDYNKTLIDTFDNIIKIKRKDNIIKMLKTNKMFSKDAKEFGDLINQKKSISFERHILLDHFDKYFTIEITPIFSKENFIGTVIFFKDITELKKNIQLIKETQNQLIEKERLASLGQLIGGIAHNLKTPIMSMSGGLEGLSDLIKEYDESIEDTAVTKEDHHDIAKEMNEWIFKMKPYLSYMSEVITTVKDQAVNLNASTNVSFTLDELIKRVDILMKHEIKYGHCKLNMDVLADSNIEVKGEVNNLVQVINNLITNAIHAYEDQGGEINLKIIQKDDNIVFSVEDFGKGIDADTQSKLFKQMFTTKGKNGTGLGLYMSYSTIKGRLGGDMWFESKEGKETTFYVSIPV